MYHKCHPISRFLIFAAPLIRTHETKFQNNAEYFHKYMVHFLYYRSKNGREIMMRKYADYLHYGHLGQKGIREKYYMTST